MKSVDREYVAFLLQYASHSLQHVGMLYQKSFLSLMDGRLVHSYNHCSITDTLFDKHGTFYHLMYLRTCVDGWQRVNSMFSVFKESCV